MKKIVAFSAVGLCVGFGGIGHANASYSASYSSCADVLEEYTLSLNPNYIGYDPAEAAQVKSEYPECFGGGGTTSNSQINATAFTQAISISRAIAARMNPFASRPNMRASASTGLAAGNVSQKFNVWANVDQNDTRYSYTNIANTKTKGENDVLTTVLGADYALAPNLVVGLSAAFDDGKGWGRTGNAAVKNKNDTDGYLIAPYIAYQINQELSVDASAGMGAGDFKATGGVKASADRWFAAANLNYSRWMGDWQLTGKASYLHGEEDYGNTKVNGAVRLNTDSKNKLDQIRLGAQAGYWMNGLMPFAGLSYSSNVHRSSDAGKDPLGRDTFVATLGLNFFSLSNKITGGVMFEQELNRDHSDNRVLSANVNFRF